MYVSNALTCDGLCSSLIIAFNAGRLCQKGRTSELYVHRSWMRWLHISS